MMHTGVSLVRSWASQAVRLEAEGMVVDEEEVLVGRGSRLGQDVHEGPAREREVDGSGGEPLDGVRRPPSSRGRSGVGLADGVGGVEEQVARDGARLVGPLVLVERPHEVEELDRHRRGAHQDVALAGDRDRALRRDRSPAAVEVAAHVGLGRLEGGREGRRDLDGAQAGRVAHEEPEDTLAARPPPLEGGPDLGLHPAQ